MLAAYFGKGFMPVSKLHPLPHHLCGLVNRALAGIIRRRRERLGLSLLKLAQLAGLSRQMLGYVEDDQRNLSLEALGFVAKPLGLTGSELLHEAEFWLHRMPAGCKKCHNCCLHRGRFPCLNDHGECFRPAP